MLDLDLVRRNRVFAMANSAALLQQLGSYAVTTLTAVFLVIVQARSPQETGLMLLTQPVLMAMLTPITGRLSDRVGSRVLATIGMVLMATGMVQMAFASSSVIRVLVALGTLGVGNAAFNAPNMSAVMGSVDTSQLSLASAFLGAMRFCGQGLSVAVLGAIAAWNLGPEGGRIIFLGESAGDTSAAAFAGGFRVAMLVSAVIALASALLSWIAEPKTIPEQATPPPKGDTSHLSHPS
jgi:MFS family permease